MSYIKYERVGEVSYTSYGTPAIIKEYINSHKILVQFQDDYKYEYYTTYNYFIKGSLENPYDKTVYGIGYIGDGEYKVTYKDINIGIIQKTIIAK